LADSNLLFLNNDKSTGTLFAFVNNKKTHMNRSLKIIFTLMVLSIFSACTLDEDLDPINGDTRDKYTGTWLFAESPASRNTSYSVTISNDPSNSSQVLLKNIGNMGNSYSAYGIATSSSITIPAQEIYSGITIEGTGTLTSADVMEWEYSITGGGDIEYYVATATR